MSNIWAQTISIDQNLAIKLIEQQTTLKVETIKKIGEGFDNIAYCVNSKYDFRFPRRQEGIDCMSNEIVVLPYLAAQISFSCTTPIFIGHATEMYPALFVGYAMVSGISLCDMPAQFVDDAQFAITLAQWLQQLHTVSVRVQDHHLLFESYNWKYDYQARLQQALSRIVEYEAYFIQAGFHQDQLFAAVGKLKKLIMLSGLIERTSYCHGDLYSRHIFVDQHYQLSGFIDWGDVHVGNPGIDLAAGYLVLSDRALHIFFDEYGDVTAEMKLVAVSHILCFSVPLLAYCYANNEENLKQWTILGLQRVVKIIDELKV